MRIEPYQLKYFEDCIKIIRSNTPKYLDPSEHSDYEDYLSRNEKIYFVIFKKSDIVACGGYGVNNSGTKVGLSWGLVQSKYHNKGYGSELLRYRLSHIQSNYPGIDIYLGTSQKTYKFYEKFGFIVEKVTPNGYGAELDQYDMVLKTISEN
ncbi:MAG: GNAT family N-acetyltransferase [Candidatus Marinimicrobia bacterium]|nr:GNAT family N-acetyltransferase [Candidatus Neomarinimicrobiota bacterium]